MTTYDDLPRLIDLQTGQGKHASLTASTLDVLWVLYSRVLRVDPTEPDRPDRDRFVLSKGHAPAALYAVLAARGFISESELPRFAEFDALLGRHPDRLLVPGVEVSSGSLGHGLPIAVGIAVALRAKQFRRPRVICLVGDGECDEGSIHEAIAYAGRVQLDSLTVIAIDNASSTWGWPGGLAARFEVEGWNSVTVDAHDHDTLTDALTDNRNGRPTAVVARHGANPATAS